VSIDTWQIQGSDSSHQHNLGNGLSSAVTAFLVTLTSSAFVMVMGEIAG
jgi:hypothetical protein